MFFLTPLPKNTLHKCGFKSKKHKNFKRIHVWTSQKKYFVCLLTIGMFRSFIYLRCGFFYFNFFIESFFTELKFESLKWVAVYSKISASISNVRMVFRSSNLKWLNGHKSTIWAKLPVNLSEFFAFFYFSNEKPHKLLFRPIMDWMSPSSFKR